MAKTLSAKTKRFTLAGALAGITAAAFPLAVMAQDGTASQGAGDQPLKIDEVVVTATKRAENLRDVPISIQVLSGEELREIGLDDLTELSKMTPNVKVDAEAREVSMRGLGESAGPLIDQSVALVVDGIYYGRVGYLWNAFLDIDRFEVLKGPQGTIFGKNASAGVLAFTTASPDHDWAGRVAGRLGEYEEKKLDGILNIPVWEDRIAIRLAGSSHDMGATMYNTTLDKETELSESWIVRGKVLFDVTSNLSINLMAEVYDRRLEQGLLQLTHMSPNAQAVLPLFDPEVEADDTDYRLSHNTEGIRTREGETFTSHVRWSPGFVNLAWVAGYSEARDTWILDADQTPAPLATLEPNNQWTQWSHEVRAQGDIWRIEYLLGAYYLSNDLDAQVRTTLGDPGNEDVNRLLIPEGASAIVDPFFGALDGFEEPEALDTRGNFVQEGSTLAFFGQTWTRITDDLKLILGLRYTREKKDMMGERTSEPLVTAIALGAVGGNVTTSDTFPLNGTIDQDDWSGTIAVNYRFSDNISAYLARATAFKAGGFNAASGDESDFVYDPEQAVSYEGGVKTRLWDGRARVNLGLYRTDFENLQVLIFTGSVVEGGEGTVAANAAEARVQGVELDGMIIPLPGLMIGGALAWNDAYYLSYPDAPCPVDSDEDACDLTGETLAKAPEWSAAINVSYRHALGNLPLELILRGDASFRDFHYLTADLDPLDAQDAVWQYNAAIGLGDRDGAWRFVVQGFNLTDEAVRRASRDVPFFAGSHAAYIGPPRRLTANFEFNF